jgi:cell volume regulation protein A
MVVIFSLLFQGSTIALLAKRLGLALPDSEDRSAMRQVFGDFALDGSARVADICDFYGLTIEADPNMTVAEWVRHRLGKPPVEGDVVRANELTFVVKEVQAGVIAKLGVKSS